MTRSLSRRENRAWLAVIASLAFALLCIFGPGCSRDALENAVPPLDNAPHAQRQAEKVGAGAGVNLHGKQFLGQFSTDNEPWFENVRVPASTPTIVAVMPTPIAKEMHSYEALTVIRYDESDAAVGCDAGQCIASIRRYVSGEFRNSVFCRGGGTCSGTGLTTGIDTALDPAGDVPTSGPLSGCTAPLIWTGSALGVYVTCPSPVIVSGIISGFHSKNPGDSGAPVDSGDSGPADAADAAPLFAAMTAACPKYVQAINGGGPTQTFLLTHGATGCTAAHVCGTLASVTCPDDTHATITWPAQSAVVNGVTTPACDVTLTAAGTGTLSGAVLVDPGYQTNDAGLYAWTPCQGWDAGGGNPTWTDYHQGLVMSVPPDAGGPTNISPSIGTSDGIAVDASASGTANSAMVLAASVGTIAQPFNLMMAAIVQNGGGFPMVIGAKTNALVQTGMQSATTIGCYAGGSTVTSSSHTFTNPQWIDCEYNGVSSAIYINGTSEATGNAGAASLANLAIFGTPTNWSFGMNGVGGLVVVWQGTETSQNRTDWDDIRKTLGMQ